MLRKLIVLAVIASFALMPTGTSAAQKTSGQAAASSSASTNEYFFSSDTCSTAGQDFTWLRQAGGEFSSNGMTPATGAVIQEFESFGSEAYGEVYFHDAAGTEAFEFGFQGRLQCQSESVAVVTGNWDWGYLYEFPDTGDVCTELSSLSGRVIINVNLETQESSVQIWGFFAEGEATSC